MMAVINSNYSLVAILLALFFFSLSNSRNVGEIQPHLYSRAAANGFGQAENARPIVTSAIRFIARSHAGDGDGENAHHHSRSRALTTNSFGVNGHSIQQISHSNEERLRQSTVSEECPPLPISSKPGLCQAVTCQTNDDCHRRRTTRNDMTSSTSQADKRICCFNGCVMACTHKVDAPLAFDWVEETEFKIQQKSSVNDSSPYHQSSTSSSSSSEAAIDDDEYEEGEDTLMEHDKTSVNPPTMFTQLRQPLRRLEPKTLMSSKAPHETVALPVQVAAS